MVPGRRERHLGNRHELRAVKVLRSNGYRIPIGSAALTATLRALEPDVVLIHDPYWAPQAVAGVADDLGVPTIAVHHASVALEAAAMPGPDAIWKPLLRPWFRRAYAPVAGVMSVVDTLADSGRAATLPLRFGLHPAFRPRPGEPRRDDVLYAGRLSREKDVDVLLEAAARSDEPWRLTIVGSGPLGDALAGRARRLGLSGRVSFRPHIADRPGLARLFAQARCVVMPGPHETFGLVALEAAACGTPAVACETAPSARVAGGLVGDVPARRPG